MLLSCDHITKSFGENTILSDVTFHINEHEKCAIVGINGVGKTTLLKIITGEEPCDDGNVFMGGGYTLGYLKQNQDIDSARTIYEEISLVKQDVFDLELKIRTLENDMKALQGSELDKMLDEYHRCVTEFEQKEGYSTYSEITGIIKGLGFSEEQFNQTINTLSGGQKTRVALGKILLSKPDLIILDEPTNHLDMNSISWLEGFISSYRGAVLIVSHDRYFLDKTVTKVVELDNTKCTVFSGNYSAYSEKKAFLKTSLMKAYENQQREIKHQEEVLTVRGLSKSFGDNHLFSDIDFDIKKGERIAILGDNGTGKTTLLKIITELEEADGGNIRIGTNVNIGYYDQKQQVLNNNNSIIDEIHDTYPDMTQSEIRNLLAAFLFTGDDVFKMIGDLSGGEKGRVSLAKLMLSEANFLILDEPTNHLDIISKEILENAINNYKGTVLYVSHDRYFVNRTATGILHLTGHHMDRYIGNYDYFMEKYNEKLAKAPATTSGPANSPSKAVENTDTKDDWQKQKEEKARIKKIQNRIDKIEEEIAAIEEDMKVIDDKLSDPDNACNSALLGDLTSARNADDEKLLKLMDEWEELSSSL